MGQPSDYLKVSLKKPSIFNILKGNRLFKLLSRVRTTVGWNWDLLTPSKASNSADLQNLKRSDLELKVVAPRRVRAIPTEPGKIKEGWHWAILLLCLAVLYLKLAKSSNFGKWQEVSGHGGVPSAESSA